MLKRKIKQRRRFGSVRVEGVAALEMVAGKVIPDMMTLSKDLKEVRE